MAAVAVEREGHVVETPAGTVVRFPADCAREGPCACAPGGGRPRELPVAVLGLGGDVPAGSKVTLRVSSRALSRLAVILFALPVAVMLVVAWLAAALAPGLGVPPDPTAAVAGLAGLALCCCLVGRRGGRLERTLTLNARLDRDR